MIIQDELISTNFSKGRLQKVDMIVIHVMEGTMSGTLEWFNNPKAKASAHFGLSRADDDTVIRYVKETDTAWHAGLVFEPTAPLVKARLGVNPNTYSIGIENEGTGRSRPTNAQFQKNVELVRKLCVDLQIPCNRTHVVAHNEIRKDKTCPGMISVDAIVLAVNAQAGLSPDKSATVGTFVESTYFGEPLMVTHIVSDTEWYFVKKSHLHQYLKHVEMRAFTPLSKMRIVRP